jgi:hypothetical protein
MIQALTKKKLKNKASTKTWDRNQQDVGSEGKIVPVIVGALGTIKKGSDQNLQLLPGQVIGQPQATKDYTNVHCTQHWWIAGVNCFISYWDLDLQGRLPPHI